ncbi:MAG: radical SAM protein [candidate division Zixibacteria bacterium]
MNRSSRMGYLRVSLLSSCNLNCSYCRPVGELTTPDIIAPVEKVCAAIDLLCGAGASKVRFTGGEPTLYKNLCEVVAHAKSCSPNVTTAMTTNGLALPKMAGKLGAAGLDSVNISLDTLDGVKFKTVTGFDLLNRVKEGIKAAIDTVPSVKLNCVMIRGMNDDEALAIIRFADQLGVDLRFIEFMPNKYSSPGDSRFISGGDLRASLPLDFEEISTDSSSAARYYQAESLSIRVGFIDPVSHPFCNLCNRVRLTADGWLYSCLFSSASINLFKLMSDGGSKAMRELKALLASKEFVGCPSARSDAALPSFLNLGG